MADHRTSEAEFAPMALAGETTEQSHPNNHEHKGTWMPLDKRDVTFKSGDTFAAGWFFLPEHATSETRVPAVAMAHGLGAVKEMYLEPFARRFAEAGIAVLVFDYRSLGASDDEPRTPLFPR